MRVINTSSLSPSRTNMLIVVSITLFISIITIYILIFNSKPNEFILTTPSSSLSSSSITNPLDIIMNNHKHHNITKHSLLNNNAKCLDGSSSVYYLRKASSEIGLSKWIIFFEGGGWCYTLQQCYLRSKSIVGIYIILIYYQ